MSKNILAVNSGSSSIKFSLLRNEDDDWRHLRLLAESSASGLSSDKATFKFHLTAEDVPDIHETLKVGDHAEGLSRFLKNLSERNLAVDVVCHRIVHGGNRSVNQKAATLNLI